MTDYKAQLWDEIARNDPPMAKFLRDMHGHFQTTLRTFRWLKAPRVVVCKWEHRERRA